MVQINREPGGLFNSAEHTTINGGHFTSIVGGRVIEPSGFQLLQSHVTSAAFHNSKQRVNPPRCHKHTREAVLEELFHWIAGDVPREAWIAWLNGAAGAGKSAICQSIAEICIKRGINVASFFFFRTDSTRNKFDPLVATLVYQIIQQLPETKEFVSQLIESNPLIFEQTFETQFDALILQPLRQLYVFNPNWKLLVVIDGVDECDGNDIQTDIIRTTAKLLSTKDLPLTVLFGSRRESHILMAFNSLAIDSAILKQLPLDDNYQPDVDILRFLNDSFHEIKRTHPFRDSLRDNWPAPLHVQEIVEKSSGQFIFASVVINFLSISSSNPSAGLEVVRGLRPAGRSTPFAQLDALYQYIFSQLDDTETALKILAYTIFAEPIRLRKTLVFFRLTIDDVRTILEPLASVMGAINRRGITFRHASLPDFLRDKRRSQKYCINELPTQLSISYFTSNHLKDKNDTDIVNLLLHSEASAALRSSIIAYLPMQINSMFGWLDFTPKFLKAVEAKFGGTKAHDYSLDFIAQQTRRHSPNLHQALSGLAVNKTPCICRRLVIVGDGACGKTNLLQCFALGEAPKEMVPGHICDGYVAETSYDNKPAQIVLIDTAYTSGQESYDRSRPLSYLGAHVVVIAFAINAPYSLRNVEDKWLAEVRHFCGHAIPIILVGCKADLRQIEDGPPSADAPTRLVTWAEGERVANLIGAQAYKECSALNAEGVDEIFHTAMRMSMLNEDARIDGQDLRSSEYHNADMQVDIQDRKTWGCGCCFVS